MIDTFNPTTEWYQAAFEILNYAKRNSTIDNFRYQIKLKKYSINTSPSYSEDVLNKLLLDNVILIEDGKLKIGNINNLKWLDEQLIKGNSTAWEFAENIEEKIDEYKKFDPTTLKLIGDEGEEYVICRLKEMINVSKHNEVKHVALSDDTAGFDIFTPSTINSDNHFKLEVKTTTRCIKDSFSFFLSRNEAKVASKSDNWCIVCVSKINDEFEILGHLYFFQIESRLPRNIDARSRWETCRVRIEINILRNGLP